MISVYKEVQFKKYDPYFKINPNILWTDYDLKEIKSKFRNINYDSKLDRIIIKLQNSEIILSKKWNQNLKKFEYSAAHHYFIKNSDEDTFDFLAKETNIHSLLFRIKNLLRG